MVYNKTKRNLEKAAGIVGVVFSSITVFVYAIAAVMAIIWAWNFNSITVFVGYNGSYPIYETIDYTAMYIGLFFACLIMFAFSLVTLILSAKVIKTPVEEDGTIKNRKGLRICCLVFSILSGFLVSAGLMIAVLCLKDVPGQKAQNTQNNQASVKVSPVQKVAEPRVIQPVVNNAQKEQEFVKRLNELKDLNSLEIFDEATLKKCINKLIEDYLKK